MKTTTNSPKCIFDIEYTSDLPKKLEFAVKWRDDYKEKEKNMLSLFKLKNPLSIPEILVAMYRSFNIECDRRWIWQTLARLEKKNIVSKKSAGKDNLYFIKNEDKS